MNPPTSFKRVTADLGKKQKSLLVKYSMERGWSVSYVIRRLVEKLLKGEVEL